MYKHRGVKKVGNKLICKCNNTDMTNWDENCIKRHLGLTSKGGRKHLIWQARQEEKAVKQAHVEDYVDKEQLEEAKRQELAGTRKSNISESDVKFNEGLVSTCLQS